MGISRDSWHKRRATGGKRARIRMKRKFELGRPPAGTKIGQKRIHLVRTRGGNTKHRAMRLDSGNFSWGSEAIARKCRILDVVYNASNNELVRTKTLVKNCIVLVDCTPFKQWYEAHYGLPLGRKKSKKEESAEDDVLSAKKSNHVQKKLAGRKPTAKIDPHVEEQFLTGRLLACVSSRPGQSGRCDGYIMEGKELEFYQKKLKSKKTK
uniref:40S ribosomal protein S8 n=1 Tax=Suberites domuncula TaxID=55567 RepID=Q4KTD4_SUBDO|nr:S8 [Suberites domuncula]